MNLSRILFGLCMVTWAWSAVGCAWFQPATEVRHTATASQLMDRLRMKETEIQTLKGLFRAQVQGPGIPFTQRVEGAVYYQRPDVYRVQGFNRVGGPLFELMVVRDLYRLSLPSPGQQYSGRMDQLPTIGPIAEPFALTAFAMSALTGLASVPEGAPVALFEESDRYRLDVFSAIGDPKAPARRLWFDRRTLEVVQEDRLGPDGQLMATAQFDDFRLLERSSSGERVAALPAGPAIVRPFRISVQDSRAGAMIVVTFHEIVPNVPLKPEELRVS